MKKFKRKLNHISVPLCIVASLLINFLIEVCSRRSLVQALQYLFTSPKVFLYNSLIILLTFSIVFLVKRRVFLFKVITTIWLGFGVTNGIILSNRVTPFTAIDFALLKSCLSIMNNYLNKFQLVLIVAALVLLVVFFIHSFLYAPKFKGKINYLKNSCCILAFIGSFYLVTEVAVKTNVVATYFGNIAFAYLDYGFPYCFSNTVINTGIDRPTNYSEETIDHILSSDPKETADNKDSILLANGGTSDSKIAASVSTPNIIFLQLESFFDPTLVKGVTFSSDPIPNFRKLSQDYSAGYLNVPSVGAGTANTEFEIISGMSLDFFGPGEYPYKTILKKTTCESVNYDLKSLGYSTHAIHNNKGTFYSRNKVFPMLGFDTFTSVEFMADTSETTPLGWQKDDILTNEIMDVLNSTPDQDFVYTISVQGHGAYPEYQVLENPEITVGGIDDEGLRYSYEYYVNEIHEMDKFVGQLIDTLSNYDEDVILVMYGDHLPSLSIDAEDLENGDIYQTEYVMWDNMNLPKEDKTIEAFQLTSEVLDKFNIHNGTLIKYHQDYQETSDYMDNLKLLQYDMLYGEQYVYGGINPYEKTDLRMGVKDISITDTYESGGQIYVKGNNFTAFSKVYINDSAENTVYLNPTTLLVEKDDLKPEDSIVVKQMTESNHALGITDPFVYNPPLQQALNE